MFENMKHPHKKKRAKQLQEDLPKCCTEEEPAPQRENKVKKLLEQQLECPEYKEYMAGIEEKVIMKALPADLQKMFRESMKKRNQLTEIMFIIGLERGTHILSSYGE